jgi:hypothetical protein
VKIDLDSYRRVIKPLVELHVKRNPEQDLNNTLSVIAQTTTCHIVAVGYFLAELYGMNPNLRSKLDMLEKFYSYPEVKNYKPDDISK